MNKQPNCPDCGENDITNFYTKEGVRTNAYCRECHKKRCRIRWHSKSQQEKQASRVKNLYGIEPEEYLQMHKDQQGKCAICGEEPKTKRGLHLDHCHETGKVRGLLCHGCNTGIGSFGDDTELLEKALDYLKEN